MHINIKKKNILLLLPSLKRAGAETQVIELANGMSNDLFNKTIVTFDKHNKQLIKLDQNNINYINIEKKTFVDILLAMKIAQIIDNNQIDLLHCTMQYATFIGWVSAKMSKRKPKIISAIHTTKNVNYKNELFDKCLYRFILSRTSKVIFVCHRQKEFWLVRFPELYNRSEVIYNGVDPYEFMATPAHIRQGQDIIKEFHLKDGRPVICCIARFRKEKGHIILLRAFKKICDKAYLLLVGDGSLKPEIIRFINKADMGNSVKLIGEIADVRPILAISDLMVLASTAVETFSMSMLEAMSMCVPVLASNIGGLSEAIIDGVNGILVEPGNEGMLSREIAKLISNRSQMDMMGKEARKTIENKFSNEKMIVKTQELMLSTIHV